MRQLAAIVLFLMVVGAFMTRSPVTKSDKSQGTVEDMTGASPKGLPPKVQQPLPPKVEQASVGASLWSRSEKTSALDDSRSVYWDLQADTAVPNSIGWPEKPTLHIICMKKETRVIFDFNDYMGSDDLALVYRVDKAKAKRRTVGVSEGGKVIGFWNGTGIPFLKEIEGGTQLVVGAKPYNEPQRETAFTITGISSAIKEVRAACGW